MRKIASGAMLAVAVCSAVAARAQVAYDTPSAHVEVLGLHRWTLKMLQDSISHYTKGQTLEDAACMVTLRDSLHFVEASVEWFEGYKGPKTAFLAVKVVEPQDSARVKWDVRPRNEFTTLRPDYAALILPVTDTSGGLWAGRIDNWFQYYQAEKSLREWAITQQPEKSRAAARADAERLWKFLDDHRTQADRARALSVLRTDGFRVNRYVAALILANFPESDSTWWALVRALRDPHETVRGGAERALATMPARKVDWSPVAADLRLLIGGTNLPSITSTFGLLARTQVDPKLATTLLHGNSQWVLDHMSATFPTASESAHKMLVQLHGGADLGATRADWEKWATSR